MTERIVKPYLELSSEPKSYIKFLNSCEFTEINFDLLEKLHQIEFECQLKNLDDFNLPNLNLYLSVSLICSSHDQSKEQVIKDDFHPFILKCSNQDVRLSSKILLKNGNSNQCLFKINKNTMKCFVKDLYVIIPTLEQIQENYENFLVRYSSDSCLELDNKINELKCKFENTFLNQFDLDSCKLKLQVIIHDLNKNSLQNYLTEPIYTSRINNSTSHPSNNNISTRTSLNNKNNLRIIRCSRINGNINGDDEIFLFTSFFDPNDIQVEFIQFKNDTEVSWRSFATINRTEIHSNCALIIKTPTYLRNLNEENKNNNSKIKVYFRLFRPSTQEFSEKCVFYYCHNDLLEFKSLFSENLLKESNLIKRMYNLDNSDKKSFVSSKYKRKIISSKSESKELEEQINPSKEKKKKFNLKEYDLEMSDDSEEEYIKKLDGILIDQSVESNCNYEYDDSILDFYGSEMGKIANDSNISIASSTSISSLIVKNLNLDPNKASTESQTILSYPPEKILNTLEARFEIKKEEMMRATPLEHQLKLNLDNCIAKMNGLADRTGKALVKFSKTRSLHELLKTQRFLINVQDEEGNTPIHLSILFGNFDILEMLVDIALTIPYQNLINLKNYKQLTPLLLAAYLNEKESCEFLLEANADMTHTDLHGNNVLHICIKNNNLNLLRILIKYIDKTCSYGVINNINHEGYSPLHLAVLSQSIDLVRELLYLKNLKINIQDKKYGYSALHHAASNSNLLEICKLLVKNENIDINTKGLNGCTPLHLAVANKNYLITCLLLNNNANMYVKSDMPLHCDANFFELSFKKHCVLKRAIELAIKKFKKEEPNKSSIIDNNSNIQPIKIELTDVKISQEIKKIYSEINENDCINNEELRELNIKFITSLHNLDAFHYAQGDCWMLEIFKNNKSISKRLFEKIICFETYRKLDKDLHHFLLPVNDLSKTNLDNLIKDSKNLLKCLENSSDKTQIKLSQQATLDDNDDYMVI